MPSTTTTKKETAVVPMVSQVQTAMNREDRAAMLDTLLAGSGITSDRFMAVVLNSIVRSPDLQQASLESILDAIRVSATLRLEPTGILGEGYIVRYKDKAQFEAGYRGLMKLARRSGQITAMDSQVVYTADQFEIDLGTEPRILHHPTVVGDRGNYLGAYAWARLSSGELIIDWMTQADIETVRKVSRNSSGEYSPWVNHYGEMARKTVIKRLMKRLPLGTDGELALRHEAELDAQEQPARTPSPKVTSIHERLGLAPAPEPPTTAPEPATAASEPPSASGDDPEVLTPMPVEVSATLPVEEPRDVTPDGETLEGRTTAELARVDEYGECGDQSPFDPAKTCVRARGHAGDRGGHRDDSGLVAWPVRKS